MEIVNVIKGPGSRAPQFKVKNFTKKNVICTVQYGKTKWFPLHMKTTFRIVF